MKRILLYIYIFFLCGYISATEKSEFSPELTDVGVQVFGGVTTGLGGIDVASHHPAGEGGFGILFEFYLIEAITLKTGIDVSYDCRRFKTKSSGAFDDGKTSLSYFRLTLPFLAKIPLFDNERKNILSALAGIDLSCIVGNQTYQDGWGVIMESFIYPLFNVSFVTGIECTLPMGPGKIDIGLRASFDLFEQKYEHNGETVNTGRFVRFVPTIGYTLPLSAF